MNEMTKKQVLEEFDNLMAASETRNGYQAKELRERRERVRRYIEQCKPVPLPESLSREQAEPLCRLEGSCESGADECHGDCECSPKVQGAWRELREMIIDSAPGPNAQPVPGLPAWAINNGYGWPQIASGECAHIAAPLLADIGKKVLAAAAKTEGGA
ncbi:hypothetical protein [Thioalkalivibrio sp. ALE19]|uniref:hypothetical protein n=1 Tax=Thioalkalivibrio sp. ALE19 TaxID=1266909 RepID=UPI0012DF20CF|nr:hypothetical protein [Thioalkalivibrio sp. ALE19]